MEEKAMNNMIVFVFSNLPSGNPEFPALHNEEKKKKMSNRKRKRKLYEWL